MTKTYRAMLIRFYVLTAVMLALQIGTAVFYEYRISQLMDGGITVKYEWPKVDLD